MSGRGELLIDRLQGGHGKADQANHWKIKKVVHGPCKTHVGRERQTKKGRKINEKEAHPKEGGAAPCATIRPEQKEDAED